MKIYNKTLVNLSIIFIVFAILQGCSSSKKSGSKNGTESKPSLSIRKKYATLLNVPEEKITNNKLYTFIDKWLHTSYRYGSQSKNGIDCSGFTQLLYDEVYQKKIPRTSESQYTQTEEKKKLSEGDLVFFTTIKGKKISHVGLYLQNNKFVNATNKGVAITDMTEKYWKARFVSGGKIK